MALQISSYFVGLTRVQNSGSKSVKIIIDLNKINLEVKKTLKLESDNGFDTLKATFSKNKFKNF
jgi:hypothetical protein